MPPAGCLPVRGAFGNHGRTEKYEERALLRSKTAADAAVWRHRRRARTGRVRRERIQRLHGKAFFGLPPAFFLSDRRRCAVPDGRRTARTVGRAARNLIVYDCEADDGRLLPL